MSIPYITMSEQSVLKKHASYGQLKFENKSSPFQVPWTSTIALPNSAKAAHNIQHKSLNSPNLNISLQEFLNYF